MNQFAKVARDFNARIHKEKVLFAKVVKNGEVTPVTFEFEPNKMTISNLGEDLPPSIRIWEGGKVEGSTDRNVWSGFSSEETEELQIYRLFDPDFILPYVSIEQGTEYPGPIIDGQYRIIELKLPPSLLRYFKEEEIVSRWIRLHVWADHLLGIEQQDFPPFKDAIALVFWDWPRSFLPLYL